MSTMLIERFPQLLNDAVYVSVCLAAGIDLIAAFYGCLYAGCVPVTVRPPHPQNLTATLPTVRLIVDVSGCVNNREQEHLWKNVFEI